MLEIIIRVERGDNGPIYIIEPNRISSDGALVPIADNGDAVFGDFTGLIRECRRIIINHFCFVTLSTFPKSDDFYSTEFTVPMAWFESALPKQFPDMSVEDFLDSYVWDASHVIYELARTEGAAIYEAQIA